MIALYFHSRLVPKHQGDFPQEVEFGEVGEAEYLRLSGVEGVGPTALEEVGTVKSKSTVSG